MSLKNVEYVMKRMTLHISAPHVISLIVEWHVARFIKRFVSKTLCGKKGLKIPLIHPKRNKEGVQGGINNLADIQEGNKIRLLHLEG